MDNEMLLRKWEAWKMRTRDELTYREIGEKMGFSLERAMQLYRYIDRVIFYDRTHIRNLLRGD